MLRSVTAKWEYACSRSRVSRKNAPAGVSGPCCSVALARKFERAYQGTANGGVELRLQPVAFGLPVDLPQHVRAQVDPVRIVERGQTVVLVVRAFGLRDPVDIGHEWPHPETVPGEAETAVER